ncbi:hypothetical protein AYL99_06498 [Fonsecaea erecta]|uniref:FAD/NAD(P)-binding domain-containing protein n=1 Tax=Fonsecaea erecta TaxID=1367422 RepID=A0A178ZHE3_9EURO|nr:hypothetical protein AYL99_06498 [Fonsecaea erecta]OAP59200.1 hypothetical protein AYL99_06498 [Fonsecaea erecta]
MVAELQSAPAGTLIPSKDRVEPGSVNVPVCKWPKTAETISGDPDSIADATTGIINAALNSSDPDPQRIAALFLEEGYWRDHLALSWDLRTLKGRHQIVDFISDTRLPLLKIEVDRSSAFRAPKAVNFDSPPSSTKGIQFFFTFVSQIGSGQGVARLVDQGHGEWKIFTFYTVLREIKGFEETTHHHRPKGVEHGGKFDRKNWQERRNAALNFEDSEPVVLVIGAGQGGLTIAARLQMLGVDTLVIDSEDRVGDNWRRRYHQLVLHDPVWYDHMPYLEFPSTWPIFTPKDKLAEWFEAYAKILELNVWVKTVIESSSWDETERVWTVKLRRTTATGSEIRTIHPKHLIQATGHSGKKNFPAHLKGLAQFQGHVLCHSSDFRGARKEGKGTKAVVVGSCNSAHDIAQDFYEQGYDVTMVQRSTTCIVTSQAIMQIGMKGLYEEDGPAVDDADLYRHSFPSEVLKAVSVKIAQAQADFDADILERLAKVGFQTDRGPDDAGIFMKYFQRGGGYYIDVGGSQLVADGKIKVKQGQEILEVLPHGLRFADGSELEASEIVFATGYSNMRSQAREIFGDELADRIGDVWGYNHEGEMRTIWQKSGHPGFWFMGGNLSLCRFYSKILALQIKGLLEGLYQY